MGYNLKSGLSTSKNCGFISGFFRWVALKNCGFTSGFFQWDYSLHIYLLFFCVHKIKVIPKKRDRHRKVQPTACLLSFSGGAKKRAHTQSHRTLLPKRSGQAVFWQAHASLCWAIFCKDILVIFWLFSFNILSLHYS